jgi:hypothetical protein
MTRTEERIAKIKRDLSELRARMGRIDHETFSAKRELLELETGLVALESEKGDDHA